MRYGAWQIKEYYDLSLQPKSIQRERFLMHFEKKTDSVDLTKKCNVIYEESRELSYRD
jgi:hypothetical protein